MTIQLHRSAALSTGKYPQVLNNQKAGWVPDPERAVRKTKFLVPTGNQTMIPKVCSPQLSLFTVQEEI
jgi:hypothetical protein